MANLLELLLGKDEPAPAPAPIDPLMEGVLGITSLSPILDSLLALGIAVETAAEDGLSLSDAIELYKPLATAAKSFKRLKEAKAEFADLTAYEVDVIAQNLTLKLSDLNSEKARDVTVALIQLAPGFLVLMNAIKNLREEVEVRKAKVVPE